MRYPGATWRPSPVRHPKRLSTRGLVIHWTAGHEPGDLAALTGGQVDVHFYVTKAGKVYQFLDSDSCAWHAFHTANDYCVGIEHEGSGEPWTRAQLDASAKLARWICDHYRIPIRHTDPGSSADTPAWHGIYGHRDLAGIDGNDHTDSVPAGTGWPAYLAAIKAAGSKPRHVAPYWDWLSWRLGEGKFKGRPADPARRPKTWDAAVPSAYWTRLKAFLARRK